MPAFVLVIDDDPDVPLILEKVVGLPVRYAAAWNSKLAADGAAPVASFVDVHLAGSQNGIDVIPELAKAWPGAALFVITADEREDLIGEALAVGAHDFLQKPLRPAEVRARFKARLEEARVRDGRETQRFGDLGFNYRLRRLTRAGQTTHLSQLATELFQILLEAKSDWVKKSMLKRRLWGGQAVTDNALDQRIREIRLAITTLGSEVVVVSKYGQGLCLRRAAPKSGGAPAPMGSAS